MLKRIKQIWTNFWAEITASPPDYKTRYKFIAELHNGEKITWEEDFVIIRHMEWDDMPIDQALDKVKHIGAKGYWSGNTFYPSHSVKSVSFEVIKEEE